MKRAAVDVALALVLGGAERLPGHAGGDEVDADEQHNREPHADEEQGEKPLPVDGAVHDLVEDGEEVITPDDHGRDHRDPRILLPKRHRLLLPKMLHPMCIIFVYMSNLFYIMAGMFNAQGVCPRRSGRSNRASSCAGVGATGESSWSPKRAAWLRGG